MITKDMELFADECVNRIKDSIVCDTTDYNPALYGREVLGKWFSTFVLVEIDNNITCYAKANIFLDIVKLNYNKIVRDSEILKLDIYQQIKMILLHELIHKLDPKNELQYNFALEGKDFKYKQSYYLKPTEIDAYVYTLIFCKDTLKDVLDSEIYKMYSNNKHIKRKILKTFYKLKGNTNVERNA